MSTFEFRDPDPEFAEAFRAYTFYLEDLAGLIGGQYGWSAESLAAGVHEGVLVHSQRGRVRRQALSDAEYTALDKFLRKSWGQLRRAHREVESTSSHFDEDANALLPVMAHYSLYDAIGALTVASKQRVPRDHTAALNTIGKEIVRGLFPYPWSACCTGCPQLGEVQFQGLSSEPDPVHVLTTPDPRSSEDRLAMLLRTTRAKELERRFEEQRRKHVSPGRSRRNISREQKLQAARSMPATTLFDVMWRLRKRASYGDADVFVLGAAGPVDARRFAEALVLVTDATVAAIEAVISAYVGTDTVCGLLDDYIARCGDRAGQLAFHADSLRSLRPAVRRN